LNDPDFVDKLEFKAFGFYQTLCLIISFVLQNRLLLKINSTFGLILTKMKTITIFFLFIVPLDFRKQRNTEIWKRNRNTKIIGLKVDLRLRLAKELLELGLISEKEHEDLKTELSPIIIN
jgi:hypothetical protein